MLKSRLRVPHLKRPKATSQSFAQVSNSVESDLVKQKTVSTLIDTIVSSPYNQQVSKAEVNTLVDMLDGWLNKLKK